MARTQLAPEFTVMRIVAVGAIVMAASAVATPAQDTSLSTRFDVASVRRNVSGAPIHVGPLLQPGGRVFATNVPLVEIIKTAYDLNDNQLVGAPDWAESASFDIDARAAAATTPEEASSMLRTLLATRFSLRAHTESRQLPVYMLVHMPEQPNTHGLAPAGAACAPPKPPPGVPLPPPPPPSEGGRPLRVARVPMRCPSIVFFAHSDAGTVGHVSARAMTMDSFATTLVRAVGRPVINRTRLAGEYDVDLTFGAALEAPPAGAPVEIAPALFTAIREQLGLRLDTGRAPVQVLVIDRVERPTEN